jgi:glycosyltransferase involved in cell wall biosynthesis
MLSGPAGNLSDISRGIRKRKAEMEIPLIDRTMNESHPQFGGRPRISVIVPVRNGKTHLPRCLEALSRSEFASFEVIVVDDCSTDNTPQIAEQYGARCLRTPQTMGPGGARNLGAHSADGEILAFVDADVVLPPGALRLIAEDFEGDANLAAVFGSYDDRPAWQTFVSQYKNLMHHYVHQISSESAATFWAGCGAIRKAVFEEFSGFDGAKYTAPSIEDIALGLELARCGRRILLDKRLQVKHLKRWTIRNLLRADIFYRAVPWSQLILNSRRLPRDLNLTYSSRASSLLTGLLTVVVLLLGLTLTGLMHLPSALLFVVLAFLCLMLLLLNRDVYRFFVRKRGWWFAARSVLAHWCYYLYSGVTFFVCAADHFLRSPFSSAHRARLQGN